MSAIPGLTVPVELEVNHKGKMIALPRAIQNTVITTELNLTTEGASTVTIITRDPDKLLQKAGYFAMAKGEGGKPQKPRGELHLDKTHPFVAVDFKKKTDEYTLEFEDRDFNALREDKTPAKAMRGPHMTLQRFVKQQVHRVCPHCDFVCPQLDEQQPREATKITRKNETANSPAREGIASGAAGLTAKQRQVAEELLDVVAEQNGHPVVEIAIIYAGLGETNLGEDDYLRPNSDGAAGVLQELGCPDPADVKAIARRFCKGESTGHGGGFREGGAIALSKTVSNPAEIAVRVEDPSHWPDDAYANEGVTIKRAEAIVSAYHGGVPGSSQQTKITEPAFEINKASGSLEEKESENTLTGLEGLLRNGGWQFWKLGNKFYLYTGKYLQKSRAWATISETTPGVVDLGWELDRNEPVKASKVIIEARAALWTVPLGKVIKIEGEGEVDNLQWLIQTIERKDVTDNAITITLILPERGKPEKGAAEEVVTKTITKTSGSDPGHNTSEGREGATGASVNQQVEQVIYNCNWMVHENFPYVYGGGHGKAGEPTGSPKGFDCSGAVSAALGGGDANLLDQEGQALGTEGFAEWGEPGKGQWITVWVLNTGDPHASHVFLEFTLPGEKPKYFESGGPGGQGPHWASVGNGGDFSGFQARHHKGF